MLSQYSKIRSGTILGLIFLEAIAIAIATTTQLIPLPTQRASGSHRPALPKDTIPFAKLSLVCLYWV